MVTNFSTIFVPPKVLKDNSKSNNVEPRAGLQINQQLLEIDNHGVLGLGDFEVFNIIFFVDIAAVLQRHYLFSDL